MVVASAGGSIELTPLPTTTCDSRERHRLAAGRDEGQEACRALRRERVLTRLALQRGTLRSGAAIWASARGVGSGAVSGHGLSLRSRALRRLPRCDDGAVRSRSVIEALLRPHRLRLVFLRSDWNLLLAKQPKLANRSEPAPSGVGSRRAAAGNGAEPRENKPDLRTERHQMPRRPSITPTPRRTTPNCPLRSSVRDSMSSPP